MQSWLRKLLRLHHLREDELQKQTSTLRTVLLVVLGASIPSTALTLFELPGAAPVVWLEALTIMCCLLGLALLRHRQPRLAGLLLAAFIWLVFTSVALWFSNGAPLSFSGYVLGILVASLVLSSRAGFLYFVISLATSGIVFTARGLGLQPQFDFSGQPVYAWLGGAAVFSAIAMLLSLTFRGLQSALENARRSQRHAERRAVQLQVAAEVAGETIAIQELDADQGRLLGRAASLIREKFGFYHVGIFLASDDGEEMLLSAAGGEAGQRMVEHGVPAGQPYSLPVGGASIVGTVAASGQPRIAPDVRLDDVHLKNPLLPGTRSEMALPLQINTLGGGRSVIGVLDVQSERSNAFDEDDLQILQTLADQLAVAIQNTRLLGATHRQLEELKVLNQIALAAAEAGAEAGAEADHTANDEDSLIEIATRLIGETLYPDNFGLIVLDEQARVLTPHPSYRERQGTIQPAIPLGEGITGKVAASGMSRLVNDVQTDPDYLGVDPATRSELCVPVRLHGRVYGVLNAESTRRSAFSASDERLLVTLAGQLATAIEKIRLSIQSRQQLQDMAELLRASALASTSLALKDVLESAARSISSASGADRCILSLLQAGPEQLICQQVFDPQSQMGLTPPGEALPLGKLPVLKLAAAQRVPLSLVDGQPGMPPGGAGWLQERGCRSLLAIPLIARDQVVGVVEILHTGQPQPYSQRQIDLAQTMANQMAAAVENARLFEAERSRRMEMEALRQASLRLTSSLEWKPVLQSILEQALRLIPADNAHIFLARGRSLVFGADLWSEAAPGGERTLPDLQPLSQAVAASGQKTVLPARDEGKALAGLDWPGALISLPLQVGNQVHGVMNILFRRPYHFNQDEINILELLGDQASLALENARLFASARERAKELADANERLKELDRLKNDFIQNVSHELRTPLTIVRGYAELLESGELGELNPAQLEPVKVMVRRTRMLTKLVADLTAILETEAKVQRLEMLDFARLVEGVLVDFRNALKQAGINLEASIDPELPQISGDASHLRRIVDNLVSNALKFTPAGGKIRVTVCLRQEWLLLEVADSGIGIPADKLEHVFERFYQVDSSSKRRFGGTGLGLALVREIAQAHGGRVEAESDLERGSIFRVFLPAKSEKQPYGS